MKKRIIISISAIMALIMIAVSVTYAWFINYKTNTVTANTLTVGSTSNILISTSSSGPYSTLLSYSFTGLELDDVTGDGETFTVPVMKSQISLTEHGENYQSLYSSVPDTAETWSAAISTDGTNNLTTADYISMDFYFRADTQMNVYLGANSYIKPCSTTLTGASSDNKSSFGDFSLDCIAGAARLSILDMNLTANQTKFIWIPNSEYQLSYSYATGWSMNTAGTPEDDSSLGAESGYYYYNNLKTKTYIQPIASSGIYIKDLGSSGQFITQLTETSSGSGVYEGHIKVNIWIEGCDREARRALSGGQIDVKLDFVASTVSN